MYIFEILSIVAVNCYVLITGYFQVDSKFKIKKIVSIWIKVVFYSISIYIIILLLGQKEFYIKDCIKSFFPILTQIYWFVNCYILLYILSPFINKFINQLNKKDYQKLLIILLIAFCILTSVLPSTFTFDKTGGYGIIWFVVLYLVGAYIKRFDSCTYKNRNNLYAYFIMSTVTYIIFQIIIYICNKLNIEYNVGRIRNYNFITVFLASVFLFMYFKNLNIKDGKLKNLILKVAPLTFGVYIIHEQVVLRNILYLNILKLDRYWNNIAQFIIIPIVAISVFLVCILIEKATQNTIQKWLFNIIEKIYLKITKTKYYKKIKNKMLLN